MKVLFFLTSSMEVPSPSWHLMKALLEDTLASGIRVHAIQKHFSDSALPPFPATIMGHPLFSYSQIDSKTVSKKNFVMRYLKGISYAYKARKHYKKHDDYDAVFVQSAPASLYYILTAKRFAKSRPVIYNCQDMFPGGAVASGAMPQKWMQKIFYALQRIAYKKADIITAISEDMKIKLLEQGVPEKKIMVIVNWYDDQAVREIPWKDNRFVQKYGLSPEKFYVQFAGTMSMTFNPDIVIKVAEILKEEKNIEFQMIGQGLRKELFERDAKARGLNNIVFYPFQSQDMVSDVYSASSVCMIPLKKGVIGNGVPSKTALMMACGRAIVCSVDEGCDYGRTFEREKIGFAAGTDDAEKLSSDILYLYTHPEEREQYGLRAKEYGRKEYARTVNTAKYVSLFRQMTKR